MGVQYRLFVTTMASADTLAKSGSPPPEKEFDGGQIVAAFCDLLQKQQFRDQFDMLKVGAVTLSLQNLDSKDVETRQALMQAVTLSNELSRLRDIESNLNDKLRKQTVKDFFKRGLGSRKEDIEKMLAVALAEADDLQGGTCKDDEGAEP